MTKVRLSLTIALAAASITLSAMPARRTPFTITDENGAERRVQLFGDESFHYYVDLDNGELLASNGDKLMPAEVDSKGRLIRSAACVKAAERCTALRRAANATPRRVPGLYDNSSFPVEGHQKAVVVLVEYQDVKFNLPDPVNYFSRLLNEEGFSEYYATGSARDWYLNSSGGKFDPEFDVYGPVTLQKSRSFYGGNDAYGQDNAPQKMVIEACRQLNGEVDFSQYDRDNDGYIDNVFVVYAGRGEASGGSSDCVWPHAWNLNSAEPGQNYTFDGVRLNRYACCNEWELSDLGHGYRPVGIGSFVHEFNHILGLPDLYSTAYVQGTFTPGAWDVMDYGPYNNDGCTPPQFSGWERAALGYITPKTLPAEAANIAMQALPSDYVYLIPTDNPDEFFMLEYRQKEGWDSYIPNHGMLVWHIDYDKDIWAKNTVNNDPAHNHVRLILADNEPGNASIGGDCFPGDSNVTLLSSAATPGFKTHAGASLPVDISDICEMHGRLALRLSGGQKDIEAPASVSVSDIEAGYFTVSWTTVENADGYYVAACPAMPIADSNFPYWLSAETFVPAGCTSYTIDGLTPSTQYEVSVRANDGCYGSPRALAGTLIRTLDPTLDYFAPLAVSPATVTSTGFTAAWEPLDGATEYFVDVYRLARGSEITETEHFDNITAMLPGFSTNAAGSYGMASYAGESTPSLRLSKDGEALFITSPSRLVTSISYWHRGNSTSESDSIGLFCRKGQEWTMLDARRAVTEKGGATVSYASEINDADEFKIQFIRHNKGAIALDDVEISYIAELLEIPADNYIKASAGTGMSLNVDGLEPDGKYVYSVTATDGRYTSRQSNKIEVDLSKWATVPEIGSTHPEIMVDNRTLQCTAPVEIYSIDGSRLANNVTRYTFSTQGIYIVVSFITGHSFKIAVK